MFKLESYITPILLSYVDRYIKNFRLEDSQVSLWGGDASFHNLDLRLDVLEQELQLPFSFVSGHIRELLIHVPWTKLNSQPITITINTIECTLKLRGVESNSTPEKEHHAKEKQKKTNTKQEFEAPPGYVQLLINKIVSNIRIYCNNLILKYVEEDIVLSMNVKHLKFESANEKWEPAYTELSPAQVILRKMVAVNDLTLCLDKRNAAGKIDVYQEPMLYRCSMTMHLLRHYHSATANRASTTRLDIYCNNMQFSMTEQQVPMLLRLMMLLYALHQKQLKHEGGSTNTNVNASNELRDNAENTETWTGWAWSYVSSVLPTQWDDEWNEEQLKNHSGHTVHIGFYVDILSITFKISESISTGRPYYSQKKQKYWPLLQLQLQGIYSDTIIHGIKWLNSNFGISQALLIPQGSCSCSYPEVEDATVPIPYLKMGSASNLHKTDSLFDVDAVENKNEKRNYNTSWDYHMMTNTESALLEKTPAFALDYVYQMEIPEEMTSEKLSELSSNYEYSNLSEVSSLRVCFGPLKLKVCSGLFHRIQSLKVAGSYYDYTSYSTPKPDLPLNELLPPSEDDFDALNEFISSRSTRITFFAPIIELQMMDHPFFIPTKGNLFKKKKQNAPGYLESIPKIAELPKLTIECQFLDISMRAPMYVNRLVHTTCQLPNPPKQLFEACYNNLTLKVIGVCSRIIINPHRHTTIITPCSASYSVKNILKPQYWIDSNIPHNEHTFESEGITINGTKAKIMVAYEILNNLIKMEPIGIDNNIVNSSLLDDAGKDIGFPYFELCIEGMRFKKVITNSTISLDLCIGSIKAFLFEPAEIKIKPKDKKNRDRQKIISQDIQQILFISGPEPKKDGLKPVKWVQEESPLFSATVQCPLHPESRNHPPILVFNLQEMRVCIDPLLCKWLLYMPKPNPKPDYFDPSQFKKKNISEASGSLIETPRKFGHLESIHSSSDRDQLYVLPRIQRISKEQDVNVQDRLYSILKKWFDVWKGTVLFGDLNQCTFYFPLESLSAIGSQGIQEAVESAIRQDNSQEILVLTLPLANIRSAQRHTISQYLKSFPVTLPKNIWSDDKSNFPWTISLTDLSCYTLQCKTKLTFLLPVTVSATIGLTAKSSKPDSTESETESSSYGSTLNKDLGYLGVCVHIDMSPVVISTSEVQVYLFASILYGLMQVISHLLPVKPKPYKTPELLPPVTVKITPTLSPTIRETTDTNSEKTPPVNGSKESLEKENGKLSAWVQWTITRFTVELLSNEFHAKHDDCVDSLDAHLKLVVDAEDIVSSLDYQSVYLKIKSKIGSMSIQHYKRNNGESQWKRGPFSGIVMRLQEDVSTEQRHEDNGFISITITRASCKHTHTLWGAVQKTQNEKKMDPFTNLPSTKYITEIVVNIQPIDFVLSLQTLRSFYLVLAPLFQIPALKNKSSDENNILPYLNNHVLPLAYIDIQDIRIIMPSIEMENSKNIHDVYVIQVNKILMTPSPINPICRIPCRPDIYEQAAHAGILNIPGSEIEDRQYQLDIIGFSISTGLWNEISSILSPSAVQVSNLESLSENPALEWNKLEQGQPNMTPMLNLCPVSEKCNISIIAAPAMIYQDTVICGNSMEINLVTDIYIYLCLQQIKLTSALITEFILLLQPFILKDEILKRPKIKVPYSPIESIHYEFEEDDDNVENLRDSGIETSEITSLKSFKATGISGYSIPTLTESEKQYIFPRPPNPLPPVYNVVPVEILFTAGKIVLSIYKVNINDDVDTDVPPRGIIKLDDKENVQLEHNQKSVPETEKTYSPLIYIALNQPNCFISKQKIGRKLQVSCFDLKIKFNDFESDRINHVPTEADFSISLLETRSGLPDPNTGIPLAFLTLRLSKTLSRNANLDIDISRPIRITCSNKWEHLFYIKKCLLDACSSKNRTSFESLPTAYLHKRNLPISSFKSLEQGETYTKFKKIRELFCNIHTINLSCNQLQLVLTSQTEHEVTISLNKVQNRLILYNRPEKLTNTCSLNGITITVAQNEFKKLLLNPWTLSFEVTFFWESWQSTNSEPQIYLSAESDVIIVDISPEHLECVDMVLKDLQWIHKHLPNKEDDKEEIYSDIQEEKDQYYKDDLRAGAFQFVDSNVNTDDLPLPYQVLFWSNNISAMAWRYPQPRALTKVRVFPVPYKITSDTDEDIQVLCKLEYWSECRNCYLPYTEFYLSETEVSSLSLPNDDPLKIVASTWRVVLHTLCQKENRNSYDLLFVSPRALAACMRIDSYFNMKLIPSFSAALYITKIDINLFTHIKKVTEMNLPECLQSYQHDLLIYPNHKFLVLTCDNLTSYVKLWNLNTCSVELSASTKCSVLDYTYLTEQTLLEPFNYKLEIYSSDGLRCNFISRPINLRFDPNIAHTLMVNGLLWSQFYDKSERKNNFVVVTRYIICNDTNVNIRFGQTDTDEDILLLPKHFHLYCWRSQKRKQELKVALEENEWLWSGPIKINEDGFQRFKISSEKNLKILISVKSISSTQKQIVISGQLIIANMLLDNFEVKLIQSVSKENKETEFRTAPIHLVHSRSLTPSIILDSNKEYFLRCRFLGLDAAWTGDIPLREHTTGSQPWLVKVPLQEKGQFLSIWCRIVTEEIANSVRILAMLWPLFTVKSNLPIDVKVHIETPQLDVRLDSIVKGKGQLQQLYCPGTVDHSHQLTFQINNGITTPNPYVPLNYTLVDQQTFFKKMEKEDIDDILKVLYNYSVSNWPYLGDELDNMEWIIDEQPLTHVQVRYQNSCQFSSSLMVELLPWCLMVNTFGSQIRIMLSGSPLLLCKIRHNGIVAPPKLEDNFNIGINLNGEWYNSMPLQLAKSDWSQSFYMPRITGTIPLEGTISFPINCKQYISMMSISSTISNEIRITKISSTHVISNLTNTPIRTACFAVPDEDTIYEIPEHYFTLLLTPDNENNGVSLMKWSKLVDDFENIKFAFYLSFCISPDLGWSVPIRIDKPFLRKSFSILSENYSIPLCLTCQEHKGQVFLALNHDLRPQTYIENKSNIPLFCAQLLSDESIMSETQHFNWQCMIKARSTVFYTMPVISEKFPEIPQNNFPEIIVFMFAYHNSTHDNSVWSEGINVTNDNERFVHIPYHGDIKITIINLSTWTHLILECVNEVEISARDIRVRLSMNTISGESAIVDDFADKLSSAIPSSEEFRSINDESVSSVHKQLEIINRSSQSFQENDSRHKSSLVSTLPKIEKWGFLKIKVFIESWAITLSTELCSPRERCEIATLTNDNIALYISQTEILDISFTISNIQFDNQLYSRESYDFPVVFIGQTKNVPKRVMSLNIPLDSVSELQDEALLSVKIVFESSWDNIRNCNITWPKSIQITLQPCSCYIEDVYITRLSECLKQFSPSKLILLPKAKRSFIQKNEDGVVNVSDYVAWQLSLAAVPLTITSISIDPISVLLSIHCSVKLYIALDQSPLQFGKFERKRLVTTSYRLGHALTMHYLSGAIFGAGWVVSSLELLGSPGGLARAMGSGLRDFVSLPYRGLVQGPMAFLRGITQGSASLMWHVTSGTLQSVTKLASSVARNLDRLTLDEEHLRRTEEQRRQRPQGLAQGFMQGLTGLGISLLGALGGIAHHPLQSVMSEGASPRSLAAGVGLGLVGVITKPLSGAAELLALTGQGLLQGAGWTSLPSPINQPLIFQIYNSPNSSVKYGWKFSNILSQSNILFVTEATSLNNNQYEALALVLTTDAVIIINTEEDVIKKVLSLRELSCVNDNDPTLLMLKLTPHVPVKKQDDNLIEMDPISRARVADYVKNTAGLLNLQETSVTDLSDVSISPLPSSDVISTPSTESVFTMFSFYVNPQNKNYFMVLLNLAQQHPNYYFEAL